MTDATKALLTAIAIIVTVGVVQIFFAFDILVTGATGHQRFWNEIVILFGFAIDTSVFLWQVQRHRARG